MATASITISDDNQGGVTIDTEYGEKLDGSSQAHQMIYALLQAILGSAPAYRKIEDTAGDLNGESAEPSRIVVPE